MPSGGKSGGITGPWAASIARIWAMTCVTSTAGSRISMICSRSGIGVADSLIGVSNDRIDRLPRVTCEHFVAARHAEPRPQRAVVQKALDGRRQPRHVAPVYQYAVLLAGDDRGQRAGACADHRLAVQPRFQQDDAK